MNEFEVNENWELAVVVTEIFLEDIWIAINIGFGLEPVAFCTQNKGATKLRNIPFNWSTMVIVESVDIVALQWDRALLWCVSLVEKQTL